jgi:hypothetical protein
MPEHVERLARHLATMDPVGACRAVAKRTRTQLSRLALDVLRARFEGSYPSLIILTSH